jgi:hypothetical protein
VAIRRRTTEAIRAVVVALVVRSREPVERHVVLCRDNLVDLALGFFIVQVVNFLVRLVPDVTLTHHVSRKTSHLLLLDRYGTKNRSESCQLLDAAAFASTRRISGKFWHY